MQTKIFLTTLLLGLGLGINAQDNNSSSAPKTKEEVRLQRIEAKKAEDTDANDDYKGNTKLINITSDIYYLQGDEENMGVYLGKEGFLLIDTQKEEEMSHNLKLINRLSKKKPIDYLVSTSGQVKHFKSYSDLKKEGVILLSGQPNFSEEENDRLKGSSSQISDITYSNEITFNYAKEKVKLIPISNSGNSIVYFVKGNVLFTGDLFIGRKYPLFDAKKGKNFKDISNLLLKIISIADDKTKIIPGKGDITNVTAVINTLKMIETMYKKVYSYRDSGKTLEQVLAISLAINFDSQGYGNGTVTTKMFITSLYNDIAREMGPLDTRTPKEKSMARSKELQNAKKQKEGKSKN